MDSFFGKLKNAAEQAGSTASVAQEKVIQEYLPKIATILRETAGPAVLEIISDVEKLGDLSRTAYQALPMPVRLVVKEQSFIDWVLSHQDRVTKLIATQITNAARTEEKPNLLTPEKLSSSSLDAPADAIVGESEESSSDSSEII